MFETLGFLIVLGAVSTGLQKRAAEKAGIPWAEWYKMTPEQKRARGAKI